MTVIAAFTDGKRWAMASDSGWFEDDGYLGVAQDMKIWLVDESILGACGSFRVIESAKRANSSSPNVVRDALRAAELGADAEWDVLILNRSGLTHIGEDYGITSMAGKFAAVGAPKGIAIGAMEVLRGLGMSPLAIVKEAVKAAIAHNNMAVGPIKTINAERIGDDERSVSGKRPRRGAVRGKGIVSEGRGELEAGGAG